jgi:chlorobactene glucosyltransferase
MLIYQVAVTVILFFLFMLVIWNLYLFRKKKSGGPPAIEPPFISVLVPVRNEEINARSCLTSLLNQDYPRYEVIVLDDNSEDSTGEILNSLKQEYPALKIIHGKPLTEGWTGKTYACWQLAGEAKGEWLLFTDADTIHTKESLRKAINIALKRDADLLSVFPETTTVSFPEKLIMPMLFFVSFVLLPYYFVDKKGFVKFAMAVGPFMFFKGSAYEKIGGHASVKDSILEDVQLAVKIKEHGLNLAVSDGQDLCSVRMYRNFSEIWEGFSKNIFAGFGYSTPALFTIIIVFLVLFFLPFIFLLIELAGNNFGLVFQFTLIQVIILFLIRILLSVKFRLGIVSTLLHPLGAFIVPVIAFNSWRWIASGHGAKWKGRIYKIQTNRKQ